MQVSLLQGFYRTEHQVVGIIPNRKIDNYVVRISTGFDPLIDATKSVETPLKYAVKQTIAKCLSPIIEFYCEYLKNANCGLYGQRRVAVHFILEELVGKCSLWRTMIPYTKISKLSKWGVPMRDFIYDILYKMIIGRNELAYSVAGMELYKVFVSVHIHTEMNEELAEFINKNDFY